MKWSVNVVRITLICVCASTMAIAVSEKKMKKVQIQTVFLGNIYCYLLLCMLPFDGARLFFLTLSPP